MTSHDQSDDMTAPQQIAMMRKLTQEAATWLVGVNGRTLRDHSAEIPRDENGRYDGQALVQWASGRRPRPNLDDNDFERLLLVVDECAGRWEDGLAIGLRQVMAHLEEKHGDGVRVLLADEIIRVIQSEAEYWQGDLLLSEPTREQVRDELTRQKRELREFIREFIDLKLVVRCDSCRRIRKGRKWIAKDPPKSCTTRPGFCPECSG
jgi:hypothetical protein